MPHKISILVRADVGRNAIDLLVTGSRGYGPMRRVLLGSVSSELMRSAPCPVCGSPVQRIVYADNECNYCAGCQTGGRVLADRALSRLLRDARRAGSQHATSVVSRRMTEVTRMFVASAAPTPKRRVESGSATRARPARERQPPIVVGSGAPWAARRSDTATNAPIPRMRTFAGLAVRFFSGTFAYSA